MPITRKIHSIILQPLLEEHNKIANLIGHLDKEINAMLADPDPDTDFIEISITLLDNYIRRYHTIEKDVLSHFEQYDLNIEEKLKVMTLFNEHRESIPLLDTLIELNDNLAEGKGDVKENLRKIKEVCDSLHFLLHTLGKKYFSNVLIDETNHTIPNGKNDQHHHRMLDIDGEVFTDDVNASKDCILRDLSDEGVTICSEQEYSVGEKLEVRCRNVKGTPVLTCEVTEKHQEGAHFCHQLRIENASECRSIMEGLLKRKQ